MNWNVYNPLTLLLLLTATAFVSPTIYGQDAASLEQKALDESQQGKLNEALADWTALIQLDPKNAKAYYQRGLVKDDLADLTSAIADYDQAIKLDPKNEAEYNARGYAKARSGNLDEAMLDYNQALVLDAKDFEAYNNRGNAKLALNDPDGAILDYNEAIRLNPHHAHAYNGRGNASVRKGDFDQAITDFHRAIQLEPSYAHAFNGLGLADTGEGDYQTALTDFTHAITLRPEYAHAYGHRGLAAYDAGQPQDALKDFQKAVELDPTDRDSQFFIWLITASQPDQRLEATISLRKFLTGYQLDAWSLKLGHFLIEDMPPDELMESARVADEKATRKNLCEAYFYIGSKAELNGNHEDAISFFRRCVGTDEPDMNAFQVAQAKVRVVTRVASGLPPEPEPTQPAVWITGQVSVQNGILLFTTDRPVQDNPLGNLVLLGCTRETAKTLAPLYEKAAEKKVDLRLYGRLVPFAETIKGHSELLPNVQFITWKLHAPSDPEILPPKDRINITPPSAYELKPAPSHK